MSQQYKELAYCSSQTRWLDDEQFWYKRTSKLPCLGLLWQLSRQVIAALHAGSCSNHLPSHMYSRHHRAKIPGSTTVTWIYDI
ncbi:hypothetical protein WJX77_004905 [Trebouxia sp. C0004]